MNWHEYFIGIVWAVQTKSKDRSTKCGAIIVGPNHEIRSTGFNGFPRGIDDENPAYHERPLKYDYTEHAERNAIYHAARVGVSTDDCTMYIGHNPVQGICCGCARAIIQSGITKVIGPEHEFPGKGQELKDDCARAYFMLMDAGVDLRFQPMKEPRRCP